MAGVSIQVNDAEVLGALQRLSARLADMTPAFARIGEYGLASTRARIESQNAGNPIGIWLPLSERYRKSKRKLAHHPDMILELYGDLVSTLVWQPLGTTGVEWGSNRVYAAAQQFGRPEINLPGRPYLGASEADLTEIRAIIAGYIKDG